MDPAPPLAGLKNLGPDLLNPPFKGTDQYQLDNLWRGALRSIESLLPTPSSSSMTTDQTMAHMVDIATEADFGIFNDGGLELFGKYMFTFINQVFGDSEVMHRIQELYPSALYTVDYVAVPTDGEDGVHWLLRSKKYPDGIRCSVDGCRNIPGGACPRLDLGDRKPLQDYGPRGRDKNDTLCQSYTVLGYMEQALKGWRPSLKSLIFAAGGDRPARLPPRIQVTGDPKRYELQQSMVLAYLMLLSPPEGFGPESTRPTPGVGSLQSFLKARRGIYSDRWNLTQQKGRDGKRIAPDGVYPVGAYVTYTRTSEEGTRVGIVQKAIKRGGEVVSYQVREVEVAVDGRPQRYLSKRRESIDASSVSLSVGHLTGDEFIAFILITLRAWQGWGWRYYVERGKATKAQNKAAATVARRAAADPWLGSSIGLALPQERPGLVRAVIESERERESQFQAFLAQRATMRGQAARAMVPTRPPGSTATRKRSREPPFPIPSSTRKRHRRSTPTSPLTPAPGPVLAVRPEATGVGLLPDRVPPVTFASLDGPSAARNDTSLDFSTASSLDGPAAKRSPPTGSAQSPRANPSTRKRSSSPGSSQAGSPPCKGPGCNVMGGAKGRTRAPKRKTKRKRRCRRTRRRRCRRQGAR